MPLLKRLAARFPDSWQTELKRVHFKRQIRIGGFSTSEPEYAILHTFLTAGDWVLDVGANVGHYTKRCSDLVGARGRVIAFEPVPRTFSLLAANVEQFTHANVTLVNAAVSDRLDLVGMAMPRFPTGLTNYYQAHLAEAADSELSVLTVSIDSLGIGQRIALVKIDAEGHEAFVLSGMKDLIARDRPVMIVETGSDEIVSDFRAAGYDAQRLPGSPNMLFQPGS